MMVSRGWRERAFLPGVPGLVTDELVEADAARCVTPPFVEGVRVGAVVAGGDLQPPGAGVDGAGLKLGQQA